MNTPEKEDEQLAFTLELTKHQAPLTAFIRSLLPIGSDPRDILQDVNITLWKKQSIFTPGTQFKAWAFKVARYHVLNHFRSIRKNYPLVFDDELVERIMAHAEDSITSDHLEIRRKALNHCLSKLKETDRSLVKVRYSHQMTIEQYGTRENVRPDNLRNRLRSIRKALHRCITVQLRREATS